MSLRLRWWLRVALRWIGGIVLGLLIFLVFAYRRDRAPSGAPMEEKVTPEEDYLTAQIIASAIDTSVQARAGLIAESQKPGETPPTSPADNPGYSPYHYTRDAHAKGHGCVLASFTVNQHVDASLAYGVFAQPGHTWDAVVRYSNGNPHIQDDEEKDPRGMAIKLRNVDGPKLLPLEENGTTQDFILMNNPVFFIRTIEEYAEFNHLLASGHLSQAAIIKAYFLPWHPRELLLALGAGKPRPDSLMTTRYWSASAYALGPQRFVKYSAIPCAQNKPQPLDGKLTASPDYLRLELAKQSAQGGACFDFAVQSQVLGKNMPVEDTTVEWNEKDSPFVPVARIVVKPVNNNTAEMNEQCENTAFNPWHSLVDHRPAGVMNRVRKSLYAAMARFRQQKNCGGPKCDCNALNLPDNGCAAQ